MPSRKYFNVDDRSGAVAGSIRGYNYHCARLDREEGEAVIEHGLDKPQSDDL